MKYCVKKDTTIIIDGSDNSDEVMLKNVLDSGLKFEDVEIISEDEYKTRKAAQPQIDQAPTYNQLLSKEIAAIKIDNMKKDVIITSTLKSLSDLKLVVMNMKGGTV